MLALDHIVVTAKNPEEAARAVAKQQQLAVQQGGKHENWGTYNWLSFLANSCYVEWIGVFNPAKAQQSANPLIQAVHSALEQDIENIIQFAFRTENMKAYIEHFRQEGIAFTGPIEGSRVKPNGELLEWRMLFPHMPNAGSLPFLIEWGAHKNTPDKENVNDRHIASITAPAEHAALYKQLYKIDTLENVDLHFGSEKQFTIK